MNLKAFVCDCNRIINESYSQLVVINIIKIVLNLRKTNQKIEINLI